MPRNYPQAPDYDEPGFGAEKRVWDALQELPDDAVVIAQYRILDARAVTREADFIVMVPDVGIGVIEVKGGRVWSEGMEWFSRDHAGYDHAIHPPMLQVQKAGYALRDFVRSQDVRWPGHTDVVVLPDTTLADGFRASDSEPEQWIDATTNVTASLLRAIATVSPPTAEQVQDLFEVLEQRLPKPRAWEKAFDGVEAANMVTREQYAILRAVRTNDRILVTGGPGTGKTWLALEHARQETILGARVALLCYNRALALDMRRQTEAWPLEQRPAYVGTLHQLALDWTGRAVPPDADSDFWDDLPAEMAKAAEEREERFDLLVVDEAQDFAADWWPHVMTLLEDPESGPMVVFGDDDQELYGRAGADAWASFEVSLTQNVRNTAAISSLLSALCGQQILTRGPQGPAPMFLPATGGDVLEVADAAVLALQEDEQFRAGDIVLLTTKRRHPEQVRRQEEMGPNGFSSSLLASDSVAVSTVKGFKGLERPAVVLAVNDFHDVDDAVNLLLVGISRATHQIVVVGDPEQLRSVTPPRFAELLGI